MVVAQVIPDVHAGEHVGDVPVGVAEVHQVGAVEAMGDALAGSGTGKPLVIASGTLMLALGGISGRAGTEADFVPSGPRIDTENAVIAMAERGVRSSAVRLPPLVHSDLDHHGFTPALIGFARAKGYSGYPGDGANRWPAGHTLDAARLFRLALEKAPAGSRLHAVGDEGIPLREIAAAIARNLDVPTKSVPAEEVPDYFQFLATFIGLDNLTSSARTRELLGWEPAHPGLSPTPTQATTSPDLYGGSGVRDPGFCR
ncbi:3-beta hydroxysteroid dehydrogenase [Streptomyces cavernae]|uniref:3-beta hydroxysteroid dehydrogenase n=1 Tax=Streptomyces cavernae TaxID=2259034 RepID=UPI000FEBC20C|nr:3-beta hydroxysteroid dehydrogenase [Streptomyces cavernae]